MVESGGFYSTFIDPLLVKMRTKVAAGIEPGNRIIDIACGTGAQVFELAKQAKFVMGVDLSNSMINKANQTKSRLGVQNVQFKVCNAAGLVSFGMKEFDISTMSLALHQFSPEQYSLILGEMKRISTKIVIVDYAVPLPKNIFGYGSKWAEFMAGMEHNRNFKMYYKQGGLNAILKAHEITIDTSTTFAGGAFQLVVGRANQVV